ncbi:hypothetical protein CABS01_06776 [Colletotrichum abscissum]|uniref:Uncharacterized protein n=1 Tax=Colletotrichum abscissum TaxID=1671311 RepID=A0A9Q0B1Q3_9PEZI|nr:uncharacterized protein CABS01_06776 [Colletotrichum abscissum]KAI3540888.1 hypothetical protein CABS02_10913 [Colletotrichum abscissum]KAK1514797.1 hypothetical protein CABS01_06776 [Colletotrichum abscissum]
MQTDADRQPIVIDLTHIDDDSTDFSSSNDESSLPNTPEGTADQRHPSEPSKMRRARNNGSGKDTSSAGNTSSASSTPAKKKVPPSSSSPIDSNLTETDGTIGGLTPTSARKAILAAYDKLNRTRGMEHIISRKMIDDMKELLTPILAGTTVTFTNSTVYKAISSVLTARVKEGDLSQVIPESTCWAAALRCVALPLTEGQGPENSFRKDLKVRSTIMDMMEVISKILDGTMPSEILQQAPFLRRTDSIKYESQNAISAFKYLIGRDGSSSSDDEEKSKAPVEGNTSSTDSNIKGSNEVVVDKTPSLFNANPETKNTEPGHSPRLPPTMTGDSVLGRRVQLPTMGSSPFGSLPLGSSPFTRKFGSSPPVSSPLATNNYIAINASNSVHESTAKPTPATTKNKTIQSDATSQPKPVQSDDTSQSTPTDTTSAELNTKGAESSAIPTAEHRWVTSNSQGSPILNNKFTDPAVTSLKRPLVDSRWGTSPAQPMTGNIRQSEYKKRSADDVFGPTDTKAIPEKKRKRLPLFDPPTEMRDMEAEYKQMCHTRHDQQPFGMALQTSSLDASRYNDTQQQPPDVPQQTHYDDDEGLVLQPQESDTARLEISDVTQQDDTIYRGLDSSEGSSDGGRQSPIKDKAVPLNTTQRAAIFDRLHSSVKKHQDDQGIKLDKYKLIIEYWMEEHMDDGRDPLSKFDSWLDGKMEKKKARKPKSKGSTK